jgi:3-hydroxyisobutyrate dehydrogenase-like beta-hydroxyacid dehydrogenase
MERDNPSRVGVIGVGTIGTAMAANLLAAGFTVIGYDVRPERREALAELGGTAAASPGDVAAQARVVLLSLPSVAALEEVVGGEQSLVALAPEGTICVETSTLPITVKEEARAALAGAGVELLDCTVSGTGAQAREGDIVLYVSGPTATVDECGPVFAAISRAAPHVGEFGSGTMMKLISNLLVVVHTMAAGEALTLAARCGLDPVAVLDLLAAGAGNSRMLEVRGPMMARGEYPGDSATIAVLWKDVELILDLATAKDAPTPLLAATVPYFAAARAQGRVGQDPAVLAAVLAGMAGLSTVPNDREATG